MELSSEISKLKKAEEPEKLKLYKSITKSIYDLQKNGGHSVDTKDIELFFTEICNDLSSENETFVGSILEQLRLFFDSEILKRFLSDEQKNTVIKYLVSLLIKVSSDDNVQLLCLEHINSLLTSIKLTDDEVENLLSKLSEITSKKKVSDALYLEVCNCIQTFFNDYKDSLERVMHIIPQLIFPPLSHGCANIRVVAERTLDNFPKLLLYAENEEGANVLLKLLKDTYCKELLVLFLKEKQAVYVLKVWRCIVNTLGKFLHRNLYSMGSFFQIIEKGFKSSSDDVCKIAFLSWKCLINNFALNEAVLNDSKRLRFLLKPLINTSKFNETISLAVCDTWWHLAWSLSHNLSTRFTEVCIPLLEYTVGKVSTGKVLAGTVGKVTTGKVTAGTVEKSLPKSTQVFLAKRGCHFLLRLLEQPPNGAFSKISSPKKLPPLLYPALQVPLDSKVIVRHSKEIVSMVRMVIEAFGNSKEMTCHLDSLFKSVLFIVSTVIEDESKESVDPVLSLMDLVTAITESQMCPPLTCLKCIDSLSKLPRSILVSHCPRKSQDIICTTLLKLLMNPYLFSLETPNKKFLMAYNRLIQAGLCESLNPLLITHKYINIVKTLVFSENTDKEILYEMWSGIASSLLESIEKTQEVNQGDKHEHDFSCLYDVLLCPFEHNFPMSIQQLRTSPAFRLWTNLYKAFIRSSSLVTTVQPNEVCEQFCVRLKAYFKDELLEEPQGLETLCFLLEIIIDSVDFTSIGTTNSNGFTHGSLLTKRKKPLGYLTSLVELMALLLTKFYSNYVNVDDQSCTPKAQKIVQISKAGVPFQLVKTFLSNLKSGSIIPLFLGVLAIPLSKFFLVNQKKYANTMGTKLEDLWNAITSFIEINYLGPYDSDFLNTIHPLLELCISHPRRIIKERSRRFWFATFAPSAASLKIPESLKTILKKAKLSLVPEEVPLEEFSFTPDSASLENDTINFENVVAFKEPFSKHFEVVTPKETKPSETKPIKSTSAGIKKSVDELPISEFVKIDSPCPSTLTPKRRSIRHRKSFVPALYNDLSQSQDTTTFGGSSESFDTSSSCEILEFKTQEAITSKSTLSTKKVTELLSKEDIVATISENDYELKQDNNSLKMTTNVDNITTSSDCETLNLPEIAIEDEQITNKNNNRPTTGKLNFSQEIKNEQISQHLSIESNAIDNSGEIVQGNNETYPDVVPSILEQKRSERIHQKKRNANDDLLTTKSTKKIKEALNVTTVSTESVGMKTEKVLENKTSGIPVKDCDTITNDLNYDMDAQKPAENTQYICEPIKKNSKKLTKTNSSHSFKLEAVGTHLDEAVFKLNQTCPEVIDLCDSEEIIPSSISSSDSASQKHTQTVKKVTKKSSGSRRSLKFDNYSAKTASGDCISVILPKCASVSDKAISLNNEETQESECPETPMDLIEAIEIETSNVNSEKCSLANKDSESMPLKSSENLFVCEDLSAKIDTKSIKNALSSVSEIDEKNVVNIAENTPPFCEKVCLSQNTDLVRLQSNSCKQESNEKLNLTLNATECQLPKANLKLTSSNGKEDSPKTTRVKSLRSSGKTSSRKSFDSALNEKVVKKTSKRKSMSCVNENKRLKSNTLKPIEEDKPGDIDERLHLDRNSSSDNFSLSSSVNLESDKATVVNIGNLSQQSQNTEFEKEDNSLLMEITDVISDIKDNLEFYDSSIVDFSLTNKVEKLPLCEVNYTPMLNEESKSSSKNVESLESILEDVHQKCTNNSDKNIEQSKVGDAEEITIGVILEREKLTTEVNDEILKLNVHKPLLNIQQSFQAVSRKKLETIKNVESTNTQHSICLEMSPVSTPESKEETSTVLIKRNNNTLPAKKRSLKLEVKTDLAKCPESCASLDTGVQQTNDSVDFDPPIVSITKEFYFDSQVEQDKTLSEPESLNNSDLPQTANDNNTCNFVCDNYPDVSQIGTEPLKDVKQEALLDGSNEYNNSEKYEDETNKLEHCIGAYEEVEESSCDAYQEESYENIKLVEFKEEADWNTDQSFVKSLETFKNEKSVEEGSNATEHCLETKAKEVFDEESNVLLIVSSKSGFTENSVDISTIHSDCPDSMTDNANLTPSDSYNGNSLLDVEMIGDTPNLLTCETFENDSDNKSDDPDDKEVIRKLKICNRLNSVSVEKPDIENSVLPIRKRKAKAPVRSPFAFRKRSTIIAENFSMHPEPNSIEVNNDTHLAKPNGQKKISENGVKKPRVMQNKIGTNGLIDKTDDISLSKVTQTNNKSFGHDVKKAIDTVKALKVVNYDELTNVNTRINASITFQTRRYKMIAASQKSVASEDSLMNGKSYCSEDEVSSSKQSCGILKKRKVSTDMSPSKLRKVTFSDPLVEERLFKNDDSLGKSYLKTDFLVITKEQQNDSLEDLEKIAKASSTLMTTDEVPSSNEYQNSDNLTDYSSLPVSPLLVNCEESVSSILKGLTSPTWIRGLETLLFSKNIKTIGDLCKLNVHELKALPFKSPKVVCLHKVLTAHLNQTQEKTLEKLKAVDDWCTNSSLNESSEKDVKKCQDEGEESEVESEVLQRLAEELLCKDKIKKLPTETLILLAKKCFGEVTERLEKT